MKDPRVMDQNSVHFSVQEDYVVSCNIKSIRISGIFSPSHVIYSCSNSTEATQHFVDKMVKCKKNMNSGVLSNASVANDQSSGA